MSQKLLDSSFLTAIKNPSLFSRKYQQRIFIFEFIGMALLYMGITCTVYKNPIQQRQKHTKMMHDVYISLSLYLSICLCGVINDGDFNPVVTLGRYLITLGNNNHNNINNTNINNNKINIQNNNNNKMTIKKMLLYWLGQLTGVTVSCIICKLIYDVGSGPFTPGQQYNYNSIIMYSIQQMIGTLFFVLFVLIVITKQTTFIHEECWVHLFIPICLYGGRKLSKNLGSLQPFVLVAGQVVEFVANGSQDWEFLVYVGIIAVAQFLGAGLAAGFFRFFFYKQLNKWRNQQ